MEPQLRCPLLFILQLIYQDSPIRIINLFNHSSLMKDYSDTNQQFYNTNNAFQKQTLWKDSEITIQYVAPELSFSKEKRFKWSSIYWPQINDNNLLVKKNKKSDVNEIAIKVSKLIDEEEKNEERIKKLKKTFSIGKSHNATARKQSHSIVSMKKPFKLSSKNENILKRLLPFMSNHQSLLRDRHGNRCNLFDNPESQLVIPQEKDDFLGNSTGFKTSRKIKLELPHNYYPGPGTYELKRYLAELDEKSNSYTGRQKDAKRIQKVKS